MEGFRFPIALVLVAAAHVVVACGREEPTEITNGQGETAGEVTTNSVILQSRLTSGNERVDGDFPGAEGVARFELATSSEFNDPVTTEWLPATAEGDFLIKSKIHGLDAGTRYYYRLVFGPNRDRTLRR
jgi:alkaline phosphatase/alkaline phosphatase D